MQYTTNYHLPQWVETDRILMPDFNEAMARLESGLTAAKSAADQAQETADSGLSAAESAQAGADKNCLFKLAEHVLPADADSFSIDLSGVDLSQYRRMEVQITATLRASMAPIRMQINNSSSDRYFLANGTSSAAMPCFMGGIGGVIYLTLAPFRSYVSIGYSCMAERDTHSYAVDSDGGVAEVCAFTGIRSLQFLGMFYAGAKCTVYGVK